jgi:hypothetical protein
MSVLIRAIECFVLAVVFGLLPVGIGFMLGRITKKEDNHDEQRSDKRTQEHGDT